MPYKSVEGANGADGISGVPSTPGTNEVPGSGTNGVAARAVLIREANVGSVVLSDDPAVPYGAVYARAAFAGNGGRGGEGGAGSVAPAGSGGLGGAGGNATVQVSNLSTVLVNQRAAAYNSGASVSVAATGGAGGWGGNTGDGSFLGPPGGVGGHAGKGGNASAIASDITFISSGPGLSEGIRVTATATGGRGGDSGAALGPQPGDGNGGAGGTASATVSGVNHVASTDGNLGFVILEASAVGGRGGYSRGFFFSSQASRTIAGYGDGAPGTGGNATASIKSNTISGGQFADTVWLSAQAIGGVGADRSPDIGFIHAADGLSRAIISGNVIDLAGGNDILTIQSNVTAAAITGNTFSGGDGYDVLRLFVDNDYTGSRTAGLNFNMSLNTISGFELVTGTQYADRIIGDAGNNTIQGGSGNDVLSGGLGNDTLWGDPGADTLTGGGGADTFVFDRFNDGTFDTIRDFARGVDRIALRVSFEVFNTLPTGALPTSAFVSGLAATTADQHIIYDRQSGALYYDDDGSGGHAQVQIALLLGRPALTASDFVLI